ncbi:dephospho-CoA kinase [Salipaludibacillus agaradhaerens]|uniref:Dephospho-CoA kinase n=1 Tax=Salipaludibacillus agaradhaerens TaxID=76935 RepID=A0A9Q4AZC6_SALAG|nr:dephospho-CoA kinase [Salipaludibacillus agaradhaerens]MCR6095557.1 dephospho-CoA kinase [Salipaludibacillus agaradhaerens]MCR6114883.1 dephospho-CoA kinase [Salipaludibacillus agaradhaerens]
MIIGLTGGIASGKSTVSQMIRDEGIPVVDADIIARNVVKPGKKAYHQIIDHFGLAILKQDGQLNREKLGEIIFNDDKERDVLNQIVHPQVRKELKDQAESLQKEGHSIVILDIPLLIEGELFYLVDNILLVYVPKSIQLKRLKERNNYTEEEALKRINSQLSLDKKKAYATYIIDNSSDLTHTREQVTTLLKNLKAL